MVEEDIELNEDGLIVDCLDGSLLQDTPEERVRQRLIKTLQTDYGYPKNLIRREVPIQSGSSILLNEKDGSPIRADLVIYNSKPAAMRKDQGNILFVVECKQPTRLDGYTQLVSYIFNTSAIGGVWTNGKGMDVYRVRRKPQQGLEELLSLPRFKDNWEEEERVPRKNDLPRPHNVRFLLSNCHDKLYGRGMENEDYDLAMDMVRILLAKIQDETSPGEYAKFWITNAEYKTKEGRQEAAETVQALFREYANQYPDVFDKYEKIQVGSDCIAEAVGVLKDWSLAARDDDADEWDLMGATYEQFTHINLKRVQGQFFTNRLVVEMMVKILDPEIGKTALDPAGGSGGFCTAIFRHLRRKIIKTTAPHSAQRDRQLSAIKQNVFLVEKAKRLVKIAKCAMLMTGDGQSGMTHGNSLGAFEDFDPWIRSRCNKNDTTAPAVIATNPPFSGQKTESMITDYSILQNFDFGHSCKMNKNGIYVFSKKDDDILPQQAPELLFLERCLDWLAPGGRLGIIMPKGFLDNISYEHYRQWLLRRCILNGVVTLHKDTFQPDTGVRTCILFITKPKEGQRIPDDYPIFFAISQRIGQDSKGNNVYILDGNGKSTGELNHDLNEIADAYIKFRCGQRLMDSEYIFTCTRRKIKNHLNINPQHYSPRLNAALEHILAFDNKDGWATTTLGQLESGIEIYMGPRWNSSDIKIDNPSDKTGLVPYLTANNVLELRRFKMKWIDLKLANTEQKNCIKMLKVKQGDILISRSGTVGRVTYATKDLASNYLVSDDLVRVRVKNSKLRAYLVSYLCSETALKLMLLDEYGSVQQHLQPRHIQQLIVPVPDDWDMVRGIVEAGKKFISAMESMSKADKAIRENGFDELCKYMNYDRQTDTDSD